ncbi:unnamed protein product [Calypogeia fissa]
MNAHFRDNPGCEKVNFHWSYERLRFHDIREQLQYSCLSVLADAVSSGHPGGHIQGIREVIRLLIMK